MQPLMVKVSISNDLDPRSVLSLLPLRLLRFPLWLQLQQCHCELGPLQIYPFHLWKNIYLIFVFWISVLTCVTGLSRRQFVLPEINRWLVYRKSMILSPLPLPIPHWFAADHSMAAISDTFMLFVCGVNYVKSSFLVSFVVLCQQMPPLFCLVDFCVHDILLDICLCFVCFT